MRKICVIFKDVWRPVNLIFDILSQKFEFRLFLPPEERLQFWFYTRFVFNSEARTLRTVRDWRKGEICIAAY